MAPKQPKKQHRVPYGQGSFYYRETDQRWMGVIEAGWNNEGRRRRITVSGKDEDATWRKFTAKRKELLIEGIPEEGVSDSMTVKEWCTGWITRRQNAVKPKTFISERAVINKWVIPTLGKRRLKDVTPGDIRRLTDRALNEGSSITNARYIQRIFQQSLKEAKQEGMKVPDAALSAKKPAVASTDRAPLPWEDVARVLEVAHSRLPHWSRWVLAFRLGLRQGESLGLTWDNVDFAAKTVTIAWQLQELTRSTNGEYVIPAQYEGVQLEGRFHLLRPKSKKGHRVIPLTDAASALLMEWKSVGYRSPHGLVWPRPNGKPMPNKADRLEWKSLQEYAKISHPAGRAYHVHEIRHSTVTFLLQEGTPIPVIEAIVGHSKLVENYVHVDVGQQRAALETMRALEIEQ